MVCVTQLYCILDYRSHIQKNQSEVVSGFARNYYAQHGTCDVGSYRYCESDVNYNKTELLNEVGKERGKIEGDKGMNDIISISGVPETMLQTMYARAKETKKKNAVIHAVGLELLAKTDFKFDTKCGG